MADLNDVQRWRLRHLRIWRRLVAELAAYIEPDPKPTQEELRMLTLPEAEFMSYLETLKRDVKTLQRVMDDDSKLDYQHAAPKPRTRRRR